MREYFIERMLNSNAKNYQTVCKQMRSNSLENKVANNPFACKSYTNMVFE